MLFYLKLLLKFGSMFGELSQLACQAVRVEGDDKRPEEEGVHSEDLQSESEDSRKS